MKLSFKFTPNINSKQNGSLNIIIKAEKCIPDLVQTMMDNGVIGLTQNE